MSLHETHGLGIYQGIEKVEMEGTVRDYMKISYRDGGNLYVLATGLDAIQKYASADAAKKPKLNKLGTQEWHKTKTRVRAQWMSRKGSGGAVCGAPEREGLRFFGGYGLAAGV